VAKAIKATGNVDVYGILFDTDANRAKNRRVELRKQ